MKKTVAIVGAGTAGLVAARGIAANGIKVKVYEQKAAAGIPIHASGILSMSGLKTLGLDYTGALMNTLKGANIHAGGKVMKIRTGENVAVVLDRARLNEICMYDAEREGATVELKKRLSGHEIGAMSSENIVIGADGPVSSVAKHFSMGDIPRYSLTYKEEYNVSVPDPHVVDVFFDNRFSPGLFGWLCPNAKDILEVGIGVDSRYKNSKLALERFIQTNGIAGLIGESRPVSGGASMIPMGRRERIADLKNEVLLIGDAAGQVKATTGGGIIFGSNAALIAADSVSRHIKNGESLALYEKRFMRKYGMEMALHAFINKFYSSMSTDSLGRVISVSKSLGAEGFLGKYGDMDMPSLVIKRFFLRGLLN